MTRVSRREMLEKSMWATALAAANSAVPALVRSSDRAVGPNEMLRVAQVGVKSRGDSHMKEYTSMADVQVAAIVDIDESVIGPAMRMAEKKNGTRPAYYKDIRRMLEDKSIDAVSIATTNHTHSLFAIWSMQAGKHVYVEKPASHNIFEGRKAIEASRKFKKICQVGMQSRSNPGMREAIEFLHGGKLGRVQVARGLCYKRRTSIGKKPDGTPPKGADYNLWLGPAPLRPFNPNRFHYNWHWFWDYGNGDIGNQGVHEMDRARWGLNKKEMPLKVMTVGGRLGYEDDGETPNTQVVHFDYGDASLIFEVRGLPTDKYKCQGAGTLIGVIFQCTEGYLVNPDYKSAVAFDKDGGKIESFAGGADKFHFQNFINAVRKGGSDADINADISEGHLSAALCHLGNISYRLGEQKPLTTESPFGESELGNEAFRRMRDHLKENGVEPGQNNFVVGPSLTFDPKSENFVGNAHATKLLTRKYRDPFVVPENL